ncbi:hypothetical protein ACHAXT_013082 [Thalassiosira profunda]
MVSYENGKFVLRRGDETTNLQYKSRRTKRILLVALSCSLIYTYLVFLRSQPPQSSDLSLLAAARDAGVGSADTSSQINPDTAEDSWDGKEYTDIEESQFAPGSKEKQSVEVSPNSPDADESEDTISENSPDADEIPQTSPGLEEDEQQSEDISENSPDANGDDASISGGDERQSEDVSESGGGGDEQHTPSLALNKKYLDYLQSLDPIPRKVHMFFPDKDYWRKEPINPFVEHSILSLKKLNPEWNVTVYDDDMVDDVIRRGADANIIPKEECELLVGSKDDEGNVVHEPAHIVERSDIARLLLMFMEGGLYLDADRLISKKIEDAIQPNTRLCLPTHNDINFSQDLQCTAQGNEMFLAMIKEASTIRIPLERRWGWIKGGNLFDLGPNLYNRHIFIYLFGGDKDTHKKYENYAVPRTLIEEHADGVIVTKKEAECNDGFLVDASLPKCYGRGGLYAQYGMKAWGPLVNARWAKEDEEG